jgi:hypothetical protein
MWKHLKDKIKAILAANTLFQEVYDYEPAEFGGDPVAIVIPSANESDYRTTTENRRIYAFSVQLWVKRTDPRSPEESEKVLTDLVDSVLDDFDRYFTLGTGSPGNALTLPTGYLMIRVQALPSSWFYTQRETYYRGAEILLKIELDVDVTSIS